METEGEFADALTALQRRSPDELAAFIASLLHSTPPSIRAYLEAFIAAAEPRDVAAIVRREIRTLRAGEREYDVRHRRGVEWVARAGYTLEIIERIVSSRDGALARQRLTELLDGESQIADQCHEDDFGAEELFARVRSLLGAPAGY